MLYSAAKPCSRSSLSGDGAACCHFQLPGMSRSSFEPPPVNTSSVAEPNASASNDCGLAVDPPRQWTGSVLGRDGGEAVGQTMSQSSAFCGAGGPGLADVCAFPSGLNAPAAWAACAAYGACN